MKKIALISILLLLLLLGCEEKYDDPLGPYPTDEEGIIQRFDSLGWVAYNGGDYDLAYARFDSAVKMNPSDSRIYVGIGFANMQLGGGDPARFDMAKSSFSFVPTLEGGSPIFEVDNGYIYWGAVTPDSTLFALGVDPDNTPILGALGPTVHFIPGPSAPSDVPEQDLEIIRITDNTIVTAPTYHYGIDTFIYIPDTCMFMADYAYFDGDVSRMLALSFAGMAQTSQIQGKSDPEELLEAIIYAKATLEEYDEDNLLRADTTAIPTYVDPSITTKNVRLLLAQSYFYYGFLYNCMWELWRLDPSLIGYFDPESSSFERDLQEKLEELQQ